MQAGHIMNQVFMFIFQITRQRKDHLKIYKTKEWEFCVVTTETLTKPVSGWTRTDTSSIVTSSDQLCWR